MNRKERRAAKRVQAGGSAGPDKVRMEIERMLALAYHHRQVGDLTEAERWCERILALQPRHAQSLYLYGILAYQSGRLEAAADLLARSIAVEGQHPEWHLVRGGVLLALRRRDEAAAHLKEAVRLNPNFAAAYHQLGILFVDEGQFGEAEMNFRRAITHEPKLAAAHMNLGSVLFAQGKLEEALDFLAMRPRLNSKQPRAADEHRHGPDTPAQV